MPSILAFKRNINDRWLLLLANTLFGVTVLGWFACLV